MFALQPFWEDSGEGLSVPLAALAQDGCIVQDPSGRWTTTGTGRAVLEAARTQVDSIRGRLSEGLSREDHDGTITVLARMAANLEPSSAAQP